MQPWTEALPKRLFSASVHTGIGRLRPTTNLWPFNMTCYKGFKHVVPPYYLNDEGFPRVSLTQIVSFCFCYGNATDSQTFFNNLLKLKFPIMSLGCFSHSASQRVLHRILRFVLYHCFYSIVFIISTIKGNVSPISLETTIQFSIVVRIPCTYLVIFTTWEFNVSKCRKESHCHTFCKAAMVKLRVSNNK